MRDAIDELIDIYQRLLPGLQDRFGAVWAIVGKEGLVRTFKSYTEAAGYAEEHYPASEVLIRNTGETTESAPFLLLSQ